MFGRKKEPEPPVINEEELKKFQEPVSEPEPVKPVFKPAPTTKIGEGITMIGNFDTKDPVEIKGTLRGNIRSTSSVAISEHGALIGEAALDSMKVEGRIDGTVLCNQSAEFSSTGSMKGNLSTGTLKTADGAVFEGKLNMLPPRKEAPAKKAPEAAPQAKAQAAPATGDLKAAVNAVQGDAKSEELSKLSLQEAFAQERKGR